ncbi:hypothetical protein T439DRAFT_324763 [Meredithblackwellia eburnea MCA 4105]
MAESRSISLPKSQSQSPTSASAFTTPPAAPFPTRSSSKPLAAVTVHHYPAYDNGIPSPPPRSDTPSSILSSSTTSKPPPPSGTIGAGATAGAGAGAAAGWDAIRKRVLNPARNNWPVLNPNEPGTLHYPSYPSSAIPLPFHGGRSTPTTVTRSGTPTTGFRDQQSSSTGLARLVGARKKKQMPAISTQQKFAQDLYEVEAYFKTPAERSTVSLGSLAATSPTGPTAASSSSSSSNRKRAGSVTTAFRDESSKYDPILGLRHLAVVFEQYRPVGTLPDQAGVLALLLRPFRGDLASDENLGRVALDVFNNMCIEFQPGDGEDELERWRFLLRAMEVDSVPLRSRIARMISASISTTVHPQLWSATTSPIVIQSLLASLIHLLHVLSTSETRDVVEAGIHTSTISSLIDSLSNGSIFIPDGQQLAVALSFPLPTFSHFSPEKLSQIVAFEGLLLIALGAEPALREWLVDAGEALLERTWVEDAGGHMNGRFATLIARVFQTILSYPAAKSPNPLVAPPSPTPDLFFAPEPDPANDRRLHRLKSSLDRLLSRRFSAETVPSLSPTLRGRIVLARLSFFSSLPAPAYQQRGYDPLATSPSQSIPQLTTEIVESKKWVAKAWMVDKAPVVEAVRQSVRDLPWDSVAGVMGVMCLGMDDTVNNAVASATLPTLFQRINTDPLACASSAPLITFLRLVSSRHPTVFFKPLFALAQATNPILVQSSLATVLTLENLLGSAQYLLRDAEMMAVALMVDTGPVKTSADGRLWDKVESGKLALLVELILVVRRIRTDSNGARLEKEGAQRFADAFESRFSLFWQSREQSSLLPLSQRILVATLLFELRMLSRPLHKPLWIGRAVHWATSSTFDTRAVLATDPKSLSASFIQPHDAKGHFVDHEALDEVELSFDAVRVLYDDAIKESTRNSRASVPVPSLQASPLIAEATKQASSRLKVRSEFLSGLDLSPLSSILKLLAAVHNHLTDEDLTNLCPTAWNALNDQAPQSFYHASFLVLLAGERIPTVLKNLVAADMENTLPHVRLDTIVRLASLFSARFDILLQPTAERSRKKPFKMGRPQISFVPIEVGSADYSPPEIPEEAHLQLGSALPPDVRRALTELGWNDKSEQQTITERQRRPLTLLPWSEISNDPAFEAQGSPGRPGSPGALLRRNSSTGNSLFGGTKRKAIVTNTLSTLLLRLTTMLDDQSVSVAITARNALLVFMRDDPITLLRPILEDLSGEAKQQKHAVQLVRKLASVQSQIPFGAAHHLFNHLGGLLKTLSRESDAKNPLGILSSVLPSTSSLVHVVPEFSLRELRKNKVEQIFLSTGPFWFDSHSPSTSMFPREAPVRDLSPYRRLAVNSTTFQLATSRVAQNALQASYLRLAPREASAIRKLMGQLSLPTTTDQLPSTLDARSFVPNDRRVTDFPVKIPRAVQDSRALSALVARSWLLSLIQVLHGLSRNFNVRSELQVVFDGVNRILLIHGDDTNIVGLAIRICMLASTRFRRLFSSSDGFSLFIPALFKVFVDARDNLAIRSSILYAWQRFFRSHEESFVFQAFGALTPVFLSRGVDEGTRKRMADDLFRLIETLQMMSIDVADVAGIRGANEREEREALIQQANERPDIFLAQFTNPNSTNRIGDAKPFLMDHAIKLFLTVLAFDPTSTRAGEFLQLFRLLIPSFYSSTVKARSLLREGIEALASVYSKSGRGNKGAALKKADPTRASQRSRTSVDSRPDSEDGVSDEGADAATWLSMRRTFLLVVEAFHASGGELSSGAMRKTLDIVRMTLHEPNSSSVKSCSAFIGTYTTSVIGTSAAPTNAQVIAFLNEIAPFVRLFLQHVDFGSTFDALARLATDSVLKDDLKIVTIIVSKVIAPAVDACSVVAGQDRLLPSHQAIVRLVAAWLTHPTAGVFGELERQPGNAAFLATFIFPMALQFGAIPVSTSEDNPSSRERTRLAWLHIVAFSVNSCEIQLNQRYTSGSRVPAATIAFVCQVLKLSIVAGEGHLTKANGSWIRLASFFRTALRRGNGSFLSEDSTTRKHSLGTSPNGAPDWAPHTTFQPSSSAGTPRITIYDYSLWSLFELLSLYPNPLILHLRLTMREKLAACRFATTLGSGFPQRKDSLGASPDRRRVSVFSRPLLQGSNSQRGQRSGETLSVHGSPVLGATAEGPQAAGSRLSARRRSSSVSKSDLPFRPTLEVFARDYVPIVASTSTASLSSSTSTRAPGAFPQIKHLGPVQTPHGADYDYVRLSHERAPSDSSSFIKSIPLAVSTVERVRTVQVIFGETPIQHALLSLQPDESEDSSLSAWTKAVALRKLVQETQLLITEFSDVISAPIGKEGDPIA